MDTANDREVIVRLYAAAAGEGPWTRALEALGEGLSARTVVLLAQPTRAPKAEVLGAIGIDPEALRAFRECFCVRRALMTDGVAGPPTTGSPTGETICAPRLLLISEYVSEMAVRLAACRPHDEAAFSTEERETFAALSPHLRQAIRVARQCERANELRGEMQALGEQFGKGVAVLDASGSVLHANAMFERICSAEDGLRMRRGRLATSRVNESAFSRILARGLQGECGGRLDVLRPSGGPPYSLFVSPVASTPSIFGADGARVSVVVNDPNSVRAPTAATLSVAYGLTRAESRMVTRLADGATVCDSAEQLGISLHTARTHLKRAMAKTGVSRQTQLVRLLLTRQ